MQEKRILDFGRANLSFDFPMKLNIIRFNHISTVSRCNKFTPQRVSIQRCQRRLSTSSSSSSSSRLWHNLWRKHDISMFVAAKRAGQRKSVRTQIARDCNFIFRCFFVIFLSATAVHMDVFFWIADKNKIANICIRMATGKHLVLWHW